jgi:receptor expression-enhancing protein 5/6
MDKVEVYVKKVDDYIAQYPSVTQYEKFKEIEEKTGYSKVYFFLGAVVLLAATIFAAGGMKLFSDLLGFLYPAYCSFKALEGGKVVDGDATQWMTYWIIFSFLTLTESAAPFIVTYIKWYYLIKCVFVVWLYHPKTNGAEVIYSSAVRPYVLPMLKGTTTTSTTPAEKEPEAKKDE